MLRSSFLGGALVLISLMSSSRPAAADQRTDQIVAALGSGAQVAGVVSTDEWTWTQVDVYDEPIPIRVDILVTNGSDDRRALYMFPGSATNFGAEFFTPRDQNIAHFMRKRGYVVIGVNPRTDALPEGENGAFLATWGLAKLRDDARGVITKMQTVLPNGYDVLGHSLGAMEALDYAATYPADVQKLYLIDVVGAYDAATEPELRAQASKNFDQLQAILANGTYGIDAGFKPLALVAKYFPLETDSGYPRPAGSTFTVTGLLYFALQYTNLIDLPTNPPLTNWLPAFCAGTYTFGDAPALDSFSLDYSTFPRLLDSLLSLRSALTATAQWRDVASVFAGNGFYTILFENIRAKVHWVNAGLGYGNHPHTARLIRASSHKPVFYSVVDGYGHMDPVFASNAINFWRLLVGE